MENHIIAIITALSTLIASLSSMIPIILKAKNKANLKLDNFIKSVNDDIKQIKHAQKLDVEFKRDYYENQILKNYEKWRYKKVKNISKLEFDRIKKYYKHYINLGGNGTLKQIMETYIKWYGKVV